jgi:PAS domain S-box-containing protein
VSNVGQFKHGDRDKPIVAPEEVLETPDLFRLLVESVQDYAIFVLDPDGIIQSWNAGAERLTGYTHEEIIGRHCSIFYGPEDVAAGKPEHSLDEAARVGRYEEEGWRLREDGTHFWANVVVTALHNPNDVLIGYAKVTRDLTERHLAEQRAIADTRRFAKEEAARAIAVAQANEFSTLLDQVRSQTMELERRRAEAAAANQSKSDFLAAMSHELRTPLNAIGGYAELLAMGLRGPLTSEQRSDIDRIRSSQQRLLGIINDLLNFTRVEAGQVAYDLVNVVIADVLESVSGMLAPQLLERHLVYDESVCPRAVVARADRAKMEQILLNLLSNALKYTKPGGHIAWRCSATADRVRITLRDTGPGIPSDRLDDIFEPFVQVGRNFTHTSEGAGLGLAISRDLARAMGGELTVESTLGVGSAFSLDLPRVP